MKYIFGLLRTRQEDVFKSIEQMEETLVTNSKIELLIISLLSTILINCMLAVGLIRIIM